MNNKSENYFEFVFTNDKSTGLYNNSVQDVYHSIYGAQTEAWEKFVLPLEFEKNFLNKKEIKVLDICFGIGYNTKALIKKLLKIDYTGSVKIDALEYDKNLVLLSPFVKDGFFKNYPEISYILCSSFMNEIYDSSIDVSRILETPGNKKFIEPFYWDLIKKYKNWGYKYNPLRGNSAFLHNIYYHCISNRFKKPVNALKINKFVITPYFDDARNSIKSLSNKYDIVFLDAFTPAKLPTLWSLEFFKELFRLSCDDGLIITYSNSSAVRHALTDAGFFAGKIFDKNNRASGTIASKNKSLIKYKLNDYDLGLMKTNAGIYYKDKNLSLSADEILVEHEQRKRKLNLESSSHYIKNCNRTKKDFTNA